MAVAVTPSPIESKPARPWRDLGILAVAYSLLLVAAVLSPDAGFAPAAAFVLIIFLFRAAAAPRFGLLCTIVLTLLIPLTLAIPAGPVTLGIGRAVGFAFVAGWLASLSRPRAPLYRATPFDWAWLVLLLAILLSILSNSAQLSAAQFSQAARTFATFVVDYFLFFLAAVSIMGAGRRHFDRVLKTTATVVALISLIGIVEYVTRRNVFTYFGPVLPPGFRATLLAVAKSATRERGGLPRVLGTFEGPNRFGAAMAMGLPVLLHFWVTTKTAGRYLYALGAMACGVAALLAVSRSAFVATAIVLAVYFIGSGNFRLSVGKVGAVIAVFVIVLAVSPQQRKVFAFYFNDLTGKQQTIKGRTIRSSTSRWCCCPSPAPDQAPMARSWWRRPPLAGISRTRRRSPSSTTRISGSLLRRACSGFWRSRPSSGAASPWE
jgi:hypothetical protein